MCTVCGCGDPSATAPGHEPRAHAHDHEPGDHHGSDHHHGHDRPHVHGPDGSLHFGAGPAGVHVAGQSQTRLIEIERSILDKNDAIAAKNRARLEAEGVVAVNLMSSPGAGKTSLLVETIRALMDEGSPIAVIEGDQQTSNDAARIRAQGAPAIQINTGKGCHLDADMIAAALDHLPTPKGGYLFIENVGNLVCPAGFDLGETRRAVVASVTEGEDKPLKYPEMFARADLMIVSKLDLLPYLDFDLDAYVANARRVAPRIDVVTASVKGEPGLTAWLAWLRGLRMQRRAAAE